MNSLLARATSAKASYIYGHVRQGIVYIPVGESHVRQGVVRDGRASMGSGLGEQVREAQPTLVRCGNETVSGHAEM